jgi:large subunit ribosomal protein L35e
LTVYNQLQKQKLREQFKKAHYRPLDLRKKLTRALRRRLTPHEAAAMTVREQKKLRHFPQRRYALKG